MSEPILFTMTKRLANGNVASIPLTARQSALILILLDFHDGGVRWGAGGCTLLGRDPRRGDDAAGTPRQDALIWDPAEKLDWPVVFVFTWASLSA